MYDVWHQFVQALSAPAGFQNTHTRKFEHDPYSSRVWARGIDIVQSTPQFYDKITQIAR